MEITDALAVLVNTIHLVPVFHIHICADEVAAFSNSMPHLTIFIQRIWAGFGSRRCTHECGHHAHGPAKGE